jgi:hypothetical protein
MTGGFCWPIPKSLGPFILGQRIQCQSICRDRHAATSTAKRTMTQFAVETIDFLRPDRAPFAPLTWVEQLTH